MSEASRIRILYAIDSLARGGTELQLKGLIDRLDRTRYEPHLCTFRPTEPELLPDDCAHHFLDLRTLLSPSGWNAFRSLRSLLKRKRFDVVQTFFQDPTLLVGAASRSAGVPMRLACFRDLGFWRTRKQEIALRWVYRGMTGFVANSEAVKDHFCQMDGLPPSEVTVIPNGLEISRFPYRQPSPQPLRVGIVGNLNRHVKRTDLFVAAAGELHRRFPATQWEIVGDGHLRPALEEQARAAGLGGRIVFHGRRSDVPDLLAQWDIAVLCSDSEGFSNALLEYMLCGCTPVATAVGGNCEVIEDGVNGLLVPANDAAALADAVGSLLSDGERNRALSAAARQTVESRYSWEACIAAHDDLYRQVISDR